MEEQREETEFLVDCIESVEEESAKGQTLVVDDANTLEVSDSLVSDVNDDNLNLGGSATEDANTANSKDDVGNVSGEESCEKTLSSHDVETTDAITDDSVHEIAPEEETSTCAGNEVTGDKAICEVEDSGAASGPVGQTVEIDKSQQSSADGETFAVAEDKADQEKEPSSKNQEDDNKMDVDSTQPNEEDIGLNELGNPGSEIEVANHSESAQVPDESTQLTKEETNQDNSATVLEVFPAAEICRDEEITNVNQKEENEEAMEVDYAAEEQDVTEGGLLDNVDDESNAVIADADRNDSIVGKEMEIDEHKDNADTTSDLTGTIESADLANSTIPTEDAATGEVEPEDHNVLFDPSSDITNFIDFSGVPSWSGNIQDLKSETRNVSLKEDTKATDMAEEVATVGIENESNEAHVAFGAESPAAILGSEIDQEGKDRQCLDKKTADEQDTVREEEDFTHEAPNIDPNQKEDTKMEENPNNFDYVDEAAGSDIKSNGLKRKADVLTEDSPGEGRKSISFAKVSFAQRPSFKIGACIARAASQMAGSPSVLKGSNFGDETLSVESFVSQLHCSAADPNQENIVSEIASGFFLDYRNSISQQVTPEKVSSKRVKVTNSNGGGTEAFEFEEMGDPYWTDRVIHNGGEEQTPPTAKEDYQIVPVELKPAQAQRARRPYRRRQSQISIPHSASGKPADFDENAPAELIMNFSKTDTIPPEKSLSKMFRHFGPIQESQTEVDMEKNRARIVFKKGADAEIAYNSVGRFNIFGTKAVKYELNHTVTETFKVQPYVVSLGQEDAAPCLPS